MNKTLAGNAAKKAGKEKRRRKGKKKKERKEGKKGRERKGRKGEERGDEGKGCTVFLFLCFFFHWMLF